MYYNYMKYGYILWIDLGRKMLVALHSLMSTAALESDVFELPIYTAIGQNLCCGGEIARSTNDSNNCTNVVLLSETDVMVQCFNLKAQHLGVIIYPRPRRHFQYWG